MPAKYVMFRIDDMLITPWRHEYQLYGALPKRHWWHRRQWHYLGVFDSREEAETQMRESVALPVLASRTYFNEIGDNDIARNYPGP